MRNTALFIALLFVLAATIVGALRLPRTATVAGTFGKNIRKVDYKRAYLLPEEGDAILDSCLVLGGRFTFTENVPDDSLLRRIRFTGLRIEPLLILRPGRTVALNITSDPLRKIDGRSIAVDRPEKATDSLAAVQADSLTRADSIRREIISR